MNTRERRAKASWWLSARKPASVRERLRTSRNNVNNVLVFAHVPEERPARKVQHEGGDHIYYKCLEVGPRNVLGRERNCTLWRSHLKNFERLPPTLRDATEHPQPAKPDLVHLQPLSRRPHLRQDALIPFHLRRKVDLALRDPLQRLHPNALELGYETS